MSAAPSYQSSYYDGTVHVPPYLLATLLAQNRALRAERDATRELMANKHNSPAVKVTTYNALLETGAAPGVPAPRRPFEYVRIGCDIIGEKSGLGPKQVGVHLGAAVEAGLLRRKMEIQRGEDGSPRRVYSYAPPEGPDWERTWAHPATIEAVVSPTHAKDAKRKGDERARVRAILAQCPECGSTDVDLRCNHCGCVTPVEDIPDAPTAQKVDSAFSTDTPAQKADSAFSTTRATPREVKTPLQEGATYQAEMSSGGSPFDEDAVGASPTGEQALAAAAAVLTPVLVHAPTYIAMQARRVESDAKYITQHRPATAADIKAHLTGQQTYGGELCWADASRPSGRATQALAWDWDDDTDLQAARHAAKRLMGRGWKVLLVGNPINPHRGHLWCLFDGPVDADWALSAVQSICPELAACGERFPDPKSSNGGRLRWPGGRYHPVGAPSCPVLVAAGVEGGLPRWVDGTTPAAWALIAASVNSVSLVETAWVSPDARPQPSRAHLAMVKSMAPPAASPPTVARDNSDRFDFAAFNRDYPVEVQVEVNRQGFFTAPWRPERTPSVKLYDDGRWKDYGPDGRYGDAFDLWCALNGHWPDGAEKPDRRAALEALGALKPRTTNTPTAEPPPPPLDVLATFDVADDSKNSVRTSAVAGAWSAKPKPPEEHFCHDVSPTGKACPACGGGTWRLRETPTSDGRWLWVCADSADRLATYTARHAPVPSMPLNIVASHSASSPEDDDADYFTV